MASFSRTQEIEHAIGRNGRFALRVTSSDVEMRQVEGELAQVRVEFDLRASDDAQADEAFERVRFRVSQGDGFLEVAEPDRVEGGLGSLARMFGIGGDRVEARVVVGLPAQATVAFTGVSADVLVTGLIGPQEYRTVSGDIVLSDAAGTIRISSVSGDVSLRGVGPIALNANTVSGDVSAFAPALEAARAVTVSGDIELEGDLTGGEHRMETVSGDLSLGIVGGMTLEVRGLSSDAHVSLPHRSEGSRDRRRYVVGDGGPRVLFSSMSGDVSVRPARRFGGASGVPSAPPPPAAPTPPAPQRPPIDDARQLEILRALESGEIDVDEAARRLSGAPSDV